VDLALEGIVWPAWPRFLWQQKGQPYVFYELDGTRAVAAPGGRLWRRPDPTLVGWPTGSGTVTRITEEMYALAATVGLHVACQRASSREPTRFRFFERPADFTSGAGLGTVIGPRNGLTWLRGFQAARLLGCGLRQGPMSGGT
jgi:hypothetical protein